MKRTFLTFFLFAFTAIAAYSQTGAQLIGKWQYHGKVTAETTTLKNIAFEFTPDKKYTAVINNTKDSGTWTSENNKAKMKSNDKNKNSFEIVKYENDILTIKQNDLVFTLTKITS